MRLGGSHCPSGFFGEEKYFVPMLLVKKTESKLEDISVSASDNLFPMSNGFGVKNKSGNPEGTLSCCIHMEKRRQSKT
jgi:hypothetical protein